MQNSSSSTNLQFWHSIHVLPIENWFRHFKTKNRAYFLQEFRDIDESENILLGATELTLLSEFNRAFISTWFISEFNQIESNRLTELFQFYQTVDPKTAGSRKNKRSLNQIETAFSSAVDKVKDKCNVIILSNNRSLDPSELTTLEYFTLAKLENGKTN